MEFKGGFGVVISVMGEDVQECSDQIETFACDVGYLEDGTYPLADELSRRLNRVCAVLDEDWNFPSAWGF